MRKYKVLRFCKDEKGEIKSCRECIYHSYGKCPMQLLELVNNMVEKHEKQKGGKHEQLG